MAEYSNPFVRGLLGAQQSARQADAQNIQNLAGLLGVQNAAFEQQLNPLKIEKLRSDLEQQTKQRGALQSFASTLPDAERLKFEADPTGYMKNQNAFHAIGSGGLMGPGGVITPPAARPLPQEKWSDPYNLNGAMVQKNELTGQVRQAVNREPQTHIYQPAPVTAVTIQDPNDPNGTLVIDGRSQKVFGKGPRLTDAGKMNQKREFNMQGIGATIKEAEDILSGTKGGVQGAGQLPTGSGVGTAIDKVAGIVGMAPAGAAEADKLKAVSGALVSKMPRMEGPQSDKDVMLYKEMAGNVGDSSLPISRRIAALESVKGLWAKYEKQNPNAFADRRAPGGNVVDFGSLK